MLFLENTSEETHIIQDYKQAIQESALNNNECKFILSLIYREKALKIVELSDTHAQTENFLSSFVEKTQATLYSFTCQQENFNLRVLKDIGKNIDILYINTSQDISLIVFNFLLLLPYIKEDCLLIRHNASLENQPVDKNKKAVENILSDKLFNALQGDFILPLYSKKFFDAQGNRLYKDVHLPHTCAIRLQKEMRKNLWNVLNLLAEFNLSIEEKNRCEFYSFFEKHYSPLYALFIKSAFIMRERQEKEKIIARNKETYFQLASATILGVVLTH